MRWFVFLAIFPFGTILSDPIQFGVNPCPQVLNCRCKQEDVRRIECFGVGFPKIAEIQKVYGTNLVELELSDWQDDDFHFDWLANFTKLENFSIKDSELESLNSTKRLISIKQVNLDNSELVNDAEICKIIRNLPNLAVLSLKDNYLEKFECKDGNSLREIDLSRNRISIFDASKSIEKLNLTRNSISDLINVTNPKIIELDISHNTLTSWPSNLKLKNLRILSVSGLLFTTGFEIDAPVLEILQIDDSSLRFLDFHRIKTPMLRNISAHRLSDLRNLAGKLPETIEQAAFTDTKLRSLPDGFFGTRKGKNVKFSSIHMSCQPCLLRWALPVYDDANVQKICNISRNEIESADCRIGIAKELEIQYGKYEEDSIVECLSYGSPPPKISWYRYRPGQLLGKYDADTDRVDYTNVTQEVMRSYTILSGGALLIKSPNRSHVERYVCVVENVHGKVFEIFRFRLDYTDWYGYNVFRSVFWGGLASSLIVCLISFLLNVTWILTRKSALWWIQRAERLSRVRKMVEAMEKYRVRQMESLHEKYTKRVQIVRDNYHQQVEALRVSYTSQSEKFRDYRAAQMGAVSSQIENLRDNYNTQLARVREYGSKRAEQLWESYERQVNRMRTFSLQHRLKLMRQYKVKQRYLNKLLEGLQASSPESQIENEEKVRAALEIGGEVDLASMESPAAASRLSRSSSFHSLPEYLIDERGNVQPGIPASNTPIRFSALLNDRPTTSSQSTFSRSEIEQQQSPKK